MDKTIIIDDKNAGVGDSAVHRLAGRMGDIHRRYGLWICNVGRGGKSLPGPSGRVLPRYFEFYCLSHMFEGRGHYWSGNGRVEIMNPGDCAVVTPGIRHSYGAWEDSFYVEDTVCFTGPAADSFFKSGIIRGGIVRMGIARRLTPIIEKAIDPAVDSQIQANISLQSLLVDLYIENRTRFVSEEKYTNIGKLIAEIKKSPARWWTVAGMAEFSGLSQAQFRRVFHKHTGMSPKKYIDRLKLQSAAEKLTGNDIPIFAIAEEFGYLDPFHFSRRFKSVIGLPPAEYRKQHA
jgi:AraC-like DNA-binding protein/uncharacterized cupin superfamily protein